jgi:hypothetical protein
MWTPPRPEPKRGLLHAWRTIREVRLDPSGYPRIKKVK